MHICDLYSDECVGRTRLARSKVESYDLYIVIIAYFGDILEYTLSLFRNHLQINIVFTVAVRSIPVDSDQSCPVFFSEIGYISTVCPVDSDTFSFGYISDDRISRNRVTACSASDKQIVSAIDYDTGIRRLRPLLRSFLLDFDLLLLFFLDLIISFIVFDQLLAELGY